MQRRRRIVKWVEAALGSLAAFSFRRPILSLTLLCLLVAAALVQASQQARLALLLARPAAPCLPSPPGVVGSRRRPPVCAGGLRWLPIPCTL